MSDAHVSSDDHSVIGWDIGGSNTKVARVHRGAVLAARGRPFELRFAPDALAPLLVELAYEMGAGAADHHAVTMTAELSQMFRLKRDGVAFVIDAVARAFGPDNVSVYDVDGGFLSVEAARRAPLSVAAANWSATARLVAATNHNVILLDTGTTTTDIIPILDGKEVAIGRSDPARLASGELVYTGALRSPTESITNHVPFFGAEAGVSAEGFALSGDVHLWRGDLAPSDYTVPTPDGRPATRAFAGERLARVVCADREMLDDAGVTMIAEALADAQVARVADALWRVALRHPALRTAVVSGLGAFIGAAAARRVGLQVVRLADTIGEDAARSAPATAVALLYERSQDISPLP